MSSVAQWTDPATISEAHAWLREQAAAHGLHVDAEITQPHVRPWSTVFRAQSDGGTIYLKLCGDSQTHEPALTTLLAGTARGLVPDVLAVHPERPWMLISDGGTKLRDSHRGAALLDVWIDILPRYAELQRAFIGREDELLATGTPDRRLDRLECDLATVIDDERVLSALADDDLASSHDELRAILPVLGGLCAELAALGIGPTIDHDDLHDGNVLTRDGRAVVFDWGDACVTHPFLSLWIVQRAAARRAGVDESESAITRLRDAYLEPWGAVAPRRELRHAADIGARLGGVTRALCWYVVATKNEGAI
jgi:hypothetical protein